MTPVVEQSAYSVLGVPKNASAEQIKTAWVQLVKRFDPERHTERFMVIQKAYDQLKDPAGRAREDIKTFNLIECEFRIENEERSEAPESQLEQTIQELERQLESREVPFEELAPNLVQGYMLRSFKHVRKKLWAEAIEDWNRVLALDSTHRRAKNNLLYSYMQLGYSYAQHGLYNEAIEVWTSAAQMDPGDQALIHNLALACELTGHLEKAARYWQEVIELWKAALEQHPEDESLKNLLVEAMRQHGGRMTDAMPMVAAPPLRVYADPSVYDGVFDERLSEPSRRFFQKVHDGEFRLVISALIENRLEQAPAEVRAWFDEYRVTAETVAVTAEAVALQQAYLEAGIVTSKSLDDALHVALATVAGCPLTVSWNFRDIVHYQKVPLYNAVNVLHRRAPLEIRSPLEVIEDEDNEAFGCVEMKERCAELTIRSVDVMTPDQRIEYWRRRSEEFQREQDRLRAAPSPPPKNGAGE